MIKTIHVRKYLDKEDPSIGLSSWVLVITALLWAFQLHFIYIICTVWFRMAQFREFWLHSEKGFTSYYWLNFDIALFLGILSIFNLIQAVGKPRNWGNLVISAATFLFIAGFGYELVFLGTHQLDNRWYYYATVDEPFKSYRLLGYVSGDPTKPYARVQTETCEVVNLKMPSTGPASKIVDIDELIGRYSGKRKLQVDHFIPYGDLCLFLSDFTRGRTDLDCLARQCSSKAQIDRVR